MVYKAKINSLFISYKYLQDLKTGFKSCKSVLHTDLYNCQHQHTSTAVGSCKNQYEEHLRLMSFIFLMYLSSGGADGLCFEEVVISLETSQTNAKFGERTRSVLSGE